MVVDRRTLAVMPVVDLILKSVAGSFTEEVEVGPLCWSNELVLHVLELKTNGPVATLAGVAHTVTEQVRQVNAILRPLGGQLMPGAMHPFMDPDADTRLWPHGYNEVYAAYDRIFGCRGHGWSNLQSMHLNLPFQGDDELGRLHAAIRVVLPLIPAIAASSPVKDGRVTGLLDTRIDVYRKNQQRIPSLTGRVIPEPVFSRVAYEALLGTLYRDLAPYDPDGILQEEWVNSRGAIVRFERDSIEIRLIDIQETPAADIAVAALVLALIRALATERWQGLEVLKRADTARLVAILDQSVATGESSVIGDRDYLRLFGVRDAKLSAADLWRHLYRELLPIDAGLDQEVARAMALILAEGPLARRIMRALGPAPSRAALCEVYQELCVCLADGALFVP
ncbi:MAG: glutamate--cysteine ligase [Deltaproteobacteria bacterium]|nr:glutamate--cysteine ligase [Deltaproteobacteria bacterium]